MWLHYHDGHRHSRACQRGLGNVVSPFFMLVPPAAVMEKEVSPGTTLNLEVSNSTTFPSDRVAGENLR